MTDTSEYVLSFNTWSFAERCVNERVDNVDCEPSLTKLAQKLVAEGPHKIEPTPRRVRALFGGQYVIDTREAYHVWEHPYYPQ